MTASAAATLPMASSANARWRTGCAGHPLGKAAKKRAVVIFALATTVCGGRAHRSCDQRVSFKSRQICHSHPFETRP
jgi:hypothetical protein